MFRRHRTGRTRWVVAAAAALTLLAAGVVTAIPAQAGVVTVQNGFEGNPYEFWNARYTEGSSIVNLVPHADARPTNGGRKAAWFDAPGNVPARISTNALFLPEPSGGQVTCRAEMYLKKADAPTPTDNPRVQLTVSERRGIVDTVIDGSTYTLTNTDYGRAEFAFWPYRRDANLIVEISVTGGMAYVDDLFVRCASAIS
ncbi:hypothetical protein [Paractinoplanes rishiriensis]|uniref:Secreted protein n=1 Tax=Paractinoplanes rishiriensis TaxID=1050105 RepID=A0A919KBA0_9ACTN|nr:hypothetical protein [Actinoplanes rishiriensis]GIF02208.1 hypothetical protein Ari01nite_96720 [Actinoplanes rishiriensis]